MSRVITSKSFDDAWQKHGLKDTFLKYPLDVKKTTDLDIDKVLKAYEGRVAGVYDLPQFHIVDQNDFIAMGGYGYTADGIIAQMLTMNKQHKATQE